MASLALSAPLVAQGYRECRSITRREARNFYFAFLSLPKPQRHAIFAVYAFSRACDDYADEGDDIVHKQALLARHREALHDAFARRPTTPQFAALLDAAERYQIPEQYFDELIDGVVMDLTVTRYETFKDLERYCYLVASVVGLICIQVFGYKGRTAKEHAIALGKALQLVNIMRDVKEDAMQNRIYIPQEDLARFGYSEAELLAGKHNEAFQKLMQYQGARARRYFDSGWKLLPMVPVRTRACPAILGQLYSELLSRIERRNYNVFSGRERLSTPEKLLLAGRVWTTTTLKGLLRSGT